METLRFGSSIPGEYWGCCAVDIMQCFKYAPNEKASSPLIYGDDGLPVTGTDGELYLGTTYEEIFWSRIRIGTHCKNDMPNHTFFVILTESQVRSGTGKKWLKLLHEAGFEFIRAVDNSVYTGSKVLDTTDYSTYSRVNYIFALFRNIGSGRIENPFAPPPEWTNLGDIPEANSFLPDTEVLAEQQFAYQRAIWKDRYEGESLVTYTRSQLEEQGVPVTAPGRRLPGAAPELIEYREEREGKNGEVLGPFIPPAPIDDYDFDEEDDENYEEWG